MNAPDVVVIGAGSAGCLVAAHLARDRTRRVLLLERGPLAVPEQAITELTTLPIGPGAERVLRRQETRGRDIVRGTGIGGSSVVNGGYFLRGHLDDYRAWPWSLDEITAGFEELEPQMRASPFTDDELGEVATAFEKYWRARSPRDVGAPTGYAKPAQRARTTPDSSAWPTVGINRVRSNRTGGHRWTVADAFLRGGASGFRAAKLFLHSGPPWVWD